MVQMMELLSLSAVVNSFLVTRSEGAGMNTHTMVGLRTARYYGKISKSRQSDLHNKAIQRNLQAVLGGADFPDFLYACGSYADAHDAGEAAHWPPWQAAAVNYIRKRPDFMSGNWSLDTQRLVAFLYGVSVHYASDEFWEGLSEKLSRAQGMTGLLASFNLNQSGVGNQAENIANLGSDFFVSWALDERSIKPWERYFPIHDIAEIYHSYSYGHNFSNVTVASLAECKALFDLGLWAEKEFGKFIFHIWTEVVYKVPLITEHVLDMPLCGIDDMSIWASWVWERIARWLDDGPPSSPEPRKLASRAPPPKMDEADAWLRDFILALKPLRRFSNRLLRLEAPSLVRRIDPANLSSGLAFHGPSELRVVVKELLYHFVQFVTRRAPSADVARLISQALHLDEAVLELDQSSPAPLPESSRQNVEVYQTYEGDVAVSYFGSALCDGDFDDDGIPDLAIGAYGSGTPGRPQEGQVNLIYGNSNISHDTTFLHGPHVHARFGWDMISLDFNKDGIADLAIAAPEDSWNETLPVGDQILGDQVRFWGRIYIYFGRKNRGLSKSADVTISTSDTLTGLGMSLSRGDIDGDGFQDLIVGCPMSSYKANSTWTEYDAIHRGTVLIFKANASRDLHISLDARRDADLCLEGPRSYDWFGQSALVLDMHGGSILLVGAPGSRSPSGTYGRVYIYNVSSREGVTSATLVLEVRGIELLAEFGHAMAVSPSTKDGTGVLAIASPASGKGGTYVRGGIVWLISIDSLATSCVTYRNQDIPISQLATRAKLVGGSLHSGLYGRLGWRIAFIDVIGDDSLDLVVGAPFIGSTMLSPMQHERGAVYVWDGTHLPRGNLDRLDSHATWIVRGSRDHARMGMAFASVAVHRLAGKVKGLAIGSPLAHSELGLEMVGVVDLVSHVAGIDGAHSRLYV